MIDGDTEKKLYMLTIIKMFLSNNTRECPQSNNVCFESE